MVPSDVCDAKPPVIRPSGGPEVDVTVAASPLGGRIARVVALSIVRAHSRAAEHAPTTETTAGGTAWDVLWMVWASGAVGMPATSAGNDPPPPLSGVSRMIEPMTAFEL